MSGGKLSAGMSSMHRLRVIKMLFGLEFYRSKLELLFMSDDVIWFRI